MKYTQEEIKKMMSNGTSASVQSDISNIDVEKRLQNIKREYDLCHYDRVIDLTTDLLNTDPSNFRAIAFKGASEGWLTDLSVNHYSEAIFEMMEAIALSREISNDFENYRQIAEWVLVEFEKMLSAYLEKLYKFASEKKREMLSCEERYAESVKNALHYIQEAAKSETRFSLALNKQELDKWSRKQSEEGDKLLQLRESYKKVMESNASATGTSMQKFLESIYDKFHDYFVEFTPEMWNALDSILTQYRNLPDEWFNDGQKATFQAQRKKIDDNYMVEKQKHDEYMAELQRRRNEAYWTEHAKEKEELLSRQASLQSKIDIVNTFFPVPFFRFLCDAATAENRVNILQSYKKPEYYSVAFTNSIRTRIFIPAARR